MVSWDLMGMTTSGNLLHSYRKCLVIVSLMSEMAKQLSAISGWWYTYPSEKYESIGMMTFPIYPNIWKYQKCSKPPTRYVTIPSSHRFSFAGDFFRLCSPPARDHSSSRAPNQLSGWKNSRNCPIFHGNKNIVKTHGRFHGCISQVCIKIYTNDLYDR